MTWSNPMASAGQADNQQEPLEQGRRDEKLNIFLKIMQDHPQICCALVALVLSLVTRVSKRYSMNCSDLSRKNNICCPLVSPIVAHDSRVSW